MAISFSNQKLYQITKKIEEGDVFLMLSWNDCVKAGRELSGAAFNLYLYLAKNQDDYQFYFSPEHFRNMYGISDKTYRNARDKLFEKGYLKKGTGNKVHFDTRGGLGETKEEIKERITELYKKIAAKNEEKSLQFKHWIDEAKLYQIEDEKVYIIEGKKLITIGEELLGELSVSSIEGLL